MQIISLILTAALLLLACFPQQSSAAGDARVLHFPSVPIGKLRIAAIGDRTSNNSPPFAPAQGEVKITVPPGFVLYLELTGQVLRNPNLLDQLADQPIDSIRGEFLAMEDSEEALIERIMTKVGKIKRLQAVSTDRCEISDRALSPLKSLPNLLELSVFRGTADGRFLKDLVSCTKLEQLHAWYCPLKAENLAYLAQFKHLKNLNLSGTQLNEAGIKQIAKCTELTDLRVYKNPIHDADLRNLQTLKKLRYLDISITPCTIAGIRLLKGLPLKRLDVPEAVAPRYDNEIRSLFPGVGINHPEKREVSKEDLDTFAPSH